MLDLILKGLKAGESASVLLSRDDKGRGSVILTSKVDLDPDSSDEARRQLAATIAQPLVLRLEDEESADEELRRAIETYSGEQRASRDALAEYKQSHSSNRARAETAASSTKTQKSSGKAEAKTSGKKDAASPAPDTKPESADTNPPSLF